MTNLSALTAVRTADYLPMSALTAIGITDYLQLAALLVVFLLVCAATIFTTKWLGGVQRGQSGSTMVKILETTKIAPNKYLQIIKVGETYLAIAICKDTVSMLCEIPQEQIHLPEQKRYKHSFRDFLEKAVVKSPQEKDDGQ
jgi:flagellar protein FliO/FliZ